MSVNILNSRADSLQAVAAMATNIHAAKSLFDILKSNLGPKGTCKMLVNGAGNIKITKDGSVLLSEMMIQHPTAMILCRAASALDEVTGDGTTSNVLFSTSLMKNAEEYILYQNVHPKYLCDGFDLSLKKLTELLPSLGMPIYNKTSEEEGRDIDWEMVGSIVKTSICTKLPYKLAIHIAEEVLEAVKIIYEPKKQLDLFMVEVLTMKHRFNSETRLVRGMVMDHGVRHPDMPKKVKKAYILTLNASLEYEKSEVNANFYYESAEKREAMARSEREFTDEKVRKIIQLKQKVCEGNDNSFCVFNQKGIDPPALDMLAKEGIMALRRVKRRNMERLTLCCGGKPCNAVEDLTEEDLGYADLVYEVAVGEEKYTFVEGVRDPKSCTLLIKGSSEYSINQIKDAIRDGLRVVKNAIEDRRVLPGAGATELSLYNDLMDYSKEVRGKAKYGVMVFAESLLVLPKTLADNAGLDGKEVVLELLDQVRESGRVLGLDLETGKYMVPAAEGIWDNYSVKLQVFTIATTVAEQLLLVDEVIKAGRSMHNRPS
ncbi:molecular chaperone protein [Theileria orientalis strain Shintoku]|uniref:Molecular chaperone protein n=1 Tax=Theileria orientalis strain Shintoku TaxID=869250 RepID=J4CD87_THEOR|nr:molecular chaperone protein [Theileria orientalis strain Shintoku]BAM40712.1 molecular chaperone protein [Theileria orientalis strain Shintoku]|eukprot:XP_009691013.1 molecular chaperone protein [Theileria orientalis strain Shintoku]